MTSAQESSRMEAVLFAHKIGSPNVGARVEIDGVTHEFWGHSTKFIQEGVPVVVLLSDDPTLQKKGIHPDAMENFESAAQRLVREGVEFYTILHPTWSLPAMLWTRDYR